jgi:hypothetical protein
VRKEDPQFAQKFAPSATSRSQFGQLRIATLPPQDHAPHASTAEGVGPRSPPPAVRLFDSSPLRLSLVVDVPRAPMLS